MPSYSENELFERVVLCTRCQQQGRYRLDLGNGDFFYQCECTSLEITAIHTDPNGPGTIRCCTLPHRMVGLRPSRRLLSVGPRGRLFRERWRSREGAILQAGEDFVTVFHEDGRQVWSKDFGFSYTLLTGLLWQSERGGK
jgi:hypothetical protein